MRTLLVLIALLVPSLAFAEGPILKQSACVLTWNVPQLNTDGSNLADLKEFGVYIGSSPSAMAAPVAVVPVAVPDPATGATASWSCAGLPIGQKYAQVDAVDSAGNRSGRSAVLPFELADDVSPQPPTNLRPGP